jgi:SagB-type dehydrogenase family enzyme
MNITQSNNWLKKQELAYAVLAKNGYHTKTPHVKSTGFRTASLHYSERGNLNNIAESFLVNSFLKRNDAEINTSISSYLMDDGMKMVSLTGEEDVSAYELIPLGENTPLDLALGEVIVRRRSIRDFTGDPVPFNHLSVLLRATAGVSAIAENKLYDGNLIHFSLRTVPSGGGLYPIEIYIAVLNSKGIQKGVYRYQPIDDQLIKIGEEKILNALLSSFAGSVDMVSASHASLLFLYVAKPWKTMRKYGNRGLRFVFQEIGGMAQNLHLSATALGLGSVDCATFFEDELNKTLHLDGVYQSALHSTLVGTIA